MGDALCCAADYNIRRLLGAIARLGLGALCFALYALAVYAADLLGVRSARPRTAGANLGLVRAHPPSLRSPWLAAVG